MRVAVTGGSGFVGRAVCDRLRIVGHDVVNLDRAHGVEIMTADLTHLLAGCRAVVHLAGILGTDELFDKPEEAVNVNINGTLRVLRACQAVGASYTAISLPFVFDSMYRVTKECAYNLAMMWHRQFGLPVSHVVAFNAYGPYQAVNAHGVQKIMPTFATLGWRNRPLPIWGDGQQLMDLVHVDDIARMLVEAIRFGDGQVFDAGTGAGISVLDFAQIVLDVTGSTAGVQHLPMRRGEQPGVRIVAEGQGWDLLDWQPPARPGEIIKTIHWYREDRP